MKSANQSSVVLLATLLMLAGSAFGQWKPQKSVEIIVGTGAGGGQDKTARTLGRLLTEQRLLEPAVNIVNKPGGGGAVGWAYLNQHAGDAHYVEIANTTLLTNQINGRSAIGYADITPLAILYSESVAISVRTESSLITGRDLIERLRKDSASLSVSVGSTLGAVNHFTMALLAKAAGIDPKKLKILVFGGGAESVTNLLGGHIDAMAQAVNNALPFYQAGKMRIQIGRAHV